MLGGVTVGQRLQEGGVVASGLQELSQLFQHGGAVGRHASISCQLALRGASKLGEQLLGLWVF